MIKKKINKIIKKKGKNPIICLTAYSKKIAQIADKYCDIILVGDSLGMVLYGMKSTREVKIDTMILHARAVKNATKKSLVVFDMPYKTYTNKLIALKNAKMVIKETKCDAVKLEGGKKISGIINYLVKRGIPVVAHVGLQPQNTLKFKVKGKSVTDKKKILQDAIATSRSGAFAIIIECVVEDLAKMITKYVNVPTIGIGASKYCDGQILVTEDLLGLSDLFPRFVKRYSNLSKVIEQCIKKYANDVKTKKFPSVNNIYK
tara:strand:+ start:2168 stop:2947 length:780 start_codon:yes stop_codon:yes gene_type:complete